MTSLRHAYLIIAHTNEWQLRELLKTLDHPKNDIYLLVDRKSSLGALDNVSLSFSELFTPPRLVDIGWGDRSQIRAELYLFEQARRLGRSYAYYHLISGMDLPLQSQDEIHAFCEMHAGKEFLGVARNNEGRDARNRMYHFFMNKARIQSRVGQYFYGKLRGYLYRLQSALNIIRKDGANWRYGCNWCSVTEEFVDFLLQNKKQILKRWKFSLCADEMYKQTLACESDRFRNRIFDLSDEFTSCRREIDWKRGTPYVWRCLDYEQLAHSSMFFARKFDERVDKIIIDQLLQHLKQKQ